MQERVKWDFKEKSIRPAADIDLDLHRATLVDLIQQNTFDVYFQPVYSVRERRPIVYEALTRIKGHNPYGTVGDFFSMARQAGVIASLDIICRGNALRKAVSCGINESDWFLSINACPETLMDPDHTVASLNSEVAKCRIDPRRIVIELTEDTAISDFGKFRELVSGYREAGYRIAIDDFGAGYAGLKMLSIIEPDFVKIDRHFIADIDKATIRYNLVDSITIACNRMGIAVIAEGVELKRECDILLDLGIDLIQGFYFSKPSPDVCHDTAAAERLQSHSDRLHATAITISDDLNFIGEVADKVDPIPVETKFKAVLDQFIRQRERLLLPVADNERIVGMLHRVRFFESKVIGHRGYGIHLNTHKTIGNIMETGFLEVDASMPIEDVSQKLQERPREMLYDDICVTKHGKYYGLASVNSLLDAITRKSIRLALGSNPLTGLPGNEVIQRTIEKQIMQNMQFDVCYIDINDFKPYNDHYGFGMGDYVIKCLGKILRKTISEMKPDPVNFAGHIGGDDFILMTRPAISLEASGSIVASFKSKLLDFHGSDDHQKGLYYAKNRKGESESVKLLSLSIGILSTEVHTISSYAHVASLASEVKKYAKLKFTASGTSSIVRDRRLLG